MEATATTPYSNSPLKDPESSETPPKTTENPQTESETSSPNKLKIKDKVNVIKKIYQAMVGNTTVSIVKLKEQFSDCFDSQKQKLKDQSLSLSTAEEISKQTDGGPSNNSNELILKEIDLRMLKNKNFIEQSRNEFCIQSQLEHENIIRCLEVEEEEGKILALLEKVNKPEYLQIELDDYCEAITNEYMLKTFMTELLEALQYIHSRGIIHCDIKIENILANQKPGDSYPSLKICDFGLSRKLVEGQTEVFVPKKMGTHDYLSPEMKDNCLISNKVDIWSLGLVFYKMCTTYLPAQLNREWPSNGQKVPTRDVDWEDHINTDQLIDLISSMLTVDPKARPSCEDCLSHPYFSQ